MKLKYKKLIIIITVGALLLGFFILTLIPTGGNSSNPVEDAELVKCTNEDINNLITSYYQAKRDVNLEELEPLVSDINQIDQEKLIAQAEYVEDYQNITCYLLENKDNGAYRVYVRFDMKLKNINTLAPCLSALYVTMGSDGKNVIYLSALDKNEEDFILAADKNSHLADMQKEVNDKLQEAINADEAFRQLYQTMDQAIANVSSTPEPQADAAQPTAEPAAADPNAAGPGVQRGPGRRERRGGGDEAPRGERPVRHLPPGHRCGHSGGPDGHPLLRRCPGRTPPPRGRGRPGPVQRPADRSPPRRRPGGPERPGRGDLSGGLPAHCGAHQRARPEQSGV